MITRLIVIKEVIVNYHSEEENVPETQEPIMSHPLAPTQARAISSPARSWSIKEDEALIACYMEHCTDVIIGTYQKGTMLRRKVSESYDAAQVNRSNELPPRNAKMLENSWRMLAGEINLWFGCYEEAKMATGSAYNDENTVQTTHTLFRNSTTPKKNFMCEHVEAQNEVRRVKERKDAAVRVDVEESSGSGKRNRIDEDGDTIIGSRSHTSGGILRPDGVKKAKAKKKGKGITSKILSIAVILDAHKEVNNQSVMARIRKIELEEKKLLEMEKQRDQDIINKKIDLVQTLIAKALSTIEDDMVKKKLLLELYGEH
ncbi:Glutathione S-transferase T3 [Bienertia sinuspersici]